MLSRDLNEFRVLVIHGCCGNLKRFSRRCRFVANFLSRLILNGNFEIQHLFPVMGTFLMVSWQDESLESIFSPRP